ncbi:SRPBCC family protein [Chitinimonas lacunae]|uniref:SRPBCC domain-containing protein n=1 Tax=Chitinimonas lacunae TaxID=1963018 RepID=A0ABV8MVR1_9NEIS
MRLVPSCIALALAAPALAAETGIELSVIVNAPPAEVWKAWSTGEGIVSFFAPAARVDARPEGPYEIYFNPYAEAGKRGSDEMRVLAVDPGKLLSFTWRTPSAALGAQRTVVVLRLKPMPDGQRTEVMLNHIGWGEGEAWDKVRSQAAQLWSGALRGLKLRFDKGPYDWSGWYAKMRELRAKAGQSSELPPLPEGSVSAPATRPAATTPAPAATTPETPKSGAPANGTGSLDAARSAPTAPDSPSRPETSVK